MSNKVVITTVTALALAGFTAIPASAKSVNVNTAANVSGRADVDANADARLAGHNLRDRDRDDVRTTTRLHATRVAFHHHHMFRHHPLGWNHGMKRGWNCTVGEANCVPPGQRNL